jgi:hypothetical protein
MSSLRLDRESGRSPNPDTGFSISRKCGALPDRNKGGSEMSEHESNEGPNLFVRFFDFENMIGATLIKIVYFVGLIGIALWGLVALNGVLQASRFMGGGNALFALIIAIVGFVIWIVFWRFVCELWMVIFKIHDRLGEIRDRLPPKA